MLALATTSVAIQQMLVLPLLAQLQVTFHTSLAVDAFIVFFARSRCSGKDLWSGMIGAGAFGLLALAITEIGARRRRAAAIS